MTDPDRRRRLLVVSFHAPPGQAVGGLRWWGLSRHLAARGWQVRVVTAEREEIAESLQNGMRVDRVPRRTTVGDRYRNRKRSVMARTGGPEGGTTRAVCGDVSEQGRGGRGFLGALRREVGGILSAPDEGRGWILRGAAAVRRSVKEFDPAYVVSTGPPHSVHLATWLGVSRSEAQWTADFRDPWADTQRHHLDVAWVEPLAARLEAGVVRSASGVLTTTPELAAVFQRRFPGAQVTWLPNGVDVATLPPRRPPDPFADFSVIHLGTLYGRRDPTPVVRAFARFLGRNGGSARDVARLRFIGEVEHGFRVRMERVAFEEGIADRVDLEGSRPREEALEILAESGVSVVLAQDQATQVPAKLYEAVAMGVPTLVVTEPGSATGAAGKRLGAAVQGPDDLDGLARALEAAWSGRWAGGAPKGVAVDYADLAGELEELLLGASRADRDAALP